MPIAPDISAKLMELKKKNNLTFKEIGDEVGSSEANVRRYILGETKIPDKQLLYAIIRALGSTPEEVLGAKPEPQEQKPQAVDFSMLERQEQRHKEQMAHWTEHHKEEIASLKAAYNSTIVSQGEQLDDLKAQNKNLRTAVIVLAVMVGLFFAVYLLPDLLNGDWGHIVYDVAMRYH